MATDPRRPVRCAPRAARPAAAPKAGAPAARPLRHRLVVLAPTRREAVRLAGGWLFDRVAAGWDVTVLSGDRATPLPLHILGVRVGRLETLPVSLRRRPAARSIGVHADLYVSHPCVRRMVLDALRDGATETVFWGGAGAAGSGGASLADFAPFSSRHRLSAAAQVFKGRALRAASIPDDAVEPVEDFWTVEPLRPSTAI